MTPTKWWHPLVDSRLARERDVRPVAFGGVSENANQTVGDAEALSQSVVAALVFRLGANGRNLFVGQLSISRLRGIASTMKALVCLVLLMRGPPQVIRSRVTGLPIRMSDLMARARRGTMERLANKDMNQGFDVATALSQRDGGVIVLEPRAQNLANLRALRAGHAPDASEVRHFVGRRSRHSLPVLLFHPANYTLLQIQGQV